MNEQQLSRRERQILHSIYGVGELSATAEQLRVQTDRSEQLQRQLEELESRGAQLEEDAADAQSEADESVVAHWWRTCCGWVAGPGAAARELVVLCRADGASAGS